MWFIFLCVLSTKHQLIQNSCWGVTASWMTERQSGNAHGHTKLVSSQLLPWLPVGATQLLLPGMKREKKPWEPKGVSSQTSSWLTLRCQCHALGLGSMHWITGTTAQLHRLVQQERNGCSVLLFSGYFNNLPPNPCVRTTHITSQFCTPEV